MRKLILFSIGFGLWLLHFGGQAQNKDFTLNSASSRTSGGWLKTPFLNKVFIENKGQFVNAENPGDILYGSEIAGTSFFFTAEGLTYCVKKIEYREKEKQGDEPGSHEENWEAVTGTAGLNMKWLNANPGVQLIADDLAKEYFNYASDDPDRESVYFAKAYRKLTYKNLYPGIDAEYVFHEKEGIKYSLILYPGADPSQIRMQYSGAENIFKDAEGNIHFVSDLGEIIDHAPQTFYRHNGASVSSSFSLENNIVSFSLENYDASKTVIIDPWVVVPTTLLADLRAFDVMKDAAGNVYAYGGLGNYKLAKYNPSGMLLWTFNTVFDAATTFGDLAVDPAGNAYVMNGFATSGGVKRTKVNSAGIEVWTHGLVSGIFEHFNLAFNCNFTVLAIGGRMAMGYGDIGFLNLSLGAVTGLTNVSNSEVRSMCWSPNGNIYSLTCLTVSSTQGNFLVGRTGALGAIYSIGSGYLWAENGVAYTNGNTIFGPGWAGQNGIASDHCYIYTTNGTIVEKRNIVNGAVIISAAIPGGVAENNSGIAVDNCGNIYVGSQAAVYKFDNNLNLDTAGATGSPVYGVAIGSNGEVLAVGNGFVASLALQACGDVTCVPSGPCIPLPAELVNFTVKQAEGKVDLSWSTSSEINCDRYEIERSRDGINFEKLGTMICRENNSGAESYHLQDDDLHPGRSYYKLKQFDKDGIQTFEKTESIFIENLKADFSISPNPLKHGENLSIEYTSAEDEQAELIFYDATGRLIWKENKSFLKGMNKLSIQASFLEAGLYFLECRSKDGVSRVKVVVQ